MHVNSNVLMDFFKQGLWKPHHQYTLGLILVFKVRIITGYPSLGAMTSYYFF